jgi:AcrR family transcriptional regulator
VPRSSAFHTFGSKENLVFQLALRLLPPESPLAQYFAGMWQRVREQVEAENPAPVDAATRRALLREVVRRAVRQNHDLLAGSSRWRTFRALSMSLASFPDDERVVLTERLRMIQETYLRVMSACYEGVFARFGVRLRPGFDMAHFAGAASSALEGIATNRAFGPEVPDQTLTLPGIDGEPVEWHLAAAAFMALVDGMTEPVD